MSKAHQVESESITTLLVPVNEDFISELPSKQGGAEFRSYPKFDGTRFENPFSGWVMPGFKRVLRFMCSRAGRNFRRPLPPPEVIETELPVRKPLFLDATYSPSSLEVTWIGHSTVLLRMDGISILTDPVFSDFCSPIRTVLARRYRPTPFAIDELPDDLRLVVISHNHYDHLDYTSIVAIHQRFGNRVTFCVPKGLAAWFRCSLPGLGPIGVVELNWWETANFELDRVGKFQVISVPAQHWSMRHPFNRNRSLWCGWVVIGPKGRKFYFAGDTGYCSAFKEIGAELGPIDLAAIPIGAYKPREFLGAQHIGPFEAVEIHLEVQCKQSIGMHWGTFRLGGEEILDPRSDLALAATERNLPPKSFVTLCHGETLAV